mmetsp:Transcript_36826/g.84416  ORF Transcript_36826/g.84416 Transcript_36826/m.84416 type:complete len:149 (-) Transcript_36826:297-743(-)
MPYYVAAVKAYRPPATHCSSPRITNDLSRQSPHKAIVHSHRLNTPSPLHILSRPPKTLSLAHLSTSTPCNARNGLRALFGVGDSWRRPQHELGERSRLLAGEDIADANHRRNAEACEGEDDEEAQPIIAGAPDRRGVADSRRRSQPNY